MDLNPVILRKLRRLYWEREGNASEAIGCVADNNKVILISEESNWEKAFGCNPDENIESRVKKIRSGLRRIGCKYTFHLHTPENSLMNPSLNDIITAYYIGMPDIIVHRDGFVLYEPIRKEAIDNPSLVEKIDKECMDDDYWEWKSCVLEKLPIKEKVIWMNGG